MRILLVAILTSLFLPPHAQAGFLFWGPKKTSGTVHSTEHENYRVHFATNGRTRSVFNRHGKEEEWVQVEYKFISRAEDWRELFDPSGWTVLRFVDKKGYIKAQVALQRGDLDERGEYYGNFWVLKEKAKKMRRGVTVMIPADSVADVVQKKREVDLLIQKMNNLEAGKHEAIALAEKIDAADRKPVTDESEGYTEPEEDEEDEEEPPEKYDPFDDPHRIRNEQVRAAVEDVLAKTPDDVDSIPALPGSITNEDVTLYTQEMSADAEPSLEFVDS